MESFREAHLISHYNKRKDKFLVECVRCGAQAEVSSLMILEPLQCPKCDGRVEEAAAHKSATETETIKVKLVPATIMMSDGIPLLVYLPMMEE